MIVALTAVIALLGVAVAVLGVTRAVLQSVPAAVPLGVTGAVLLSVAVPLVPQTVPVPAAAVASFLSHGVVCVLDVRDGNNHGKMIVMKDLSHLEAVKSADLKLRWKEFYSDVVNGFLVPCAMLGLVYFDLRRGCANVRWLRERPTAATTSSTPPPEFFLIGIDSMKHFDDAMTLCISSCKTDYRYPKHTMVRSSPWNFTFVQVLLAAMWAATRIDEVTIGATWQLGCGERDADSGVLSQSFQDVNRLALSHLPTAKSDGHTTPIYTEVRVMKISHQVRSVLAPQSCYPKDRSTNGVTSWTQRPLELSDKDVWEC